MQPDRLINALTITVQILMSLVLFAIVLPFFILWRAPISLLYFTKKEKEEPKNADQEKERRQNRQADEEEEELKPDPPPDLHDRAFAPYTRQWTAFKNLPINKPLVTHWSRVACLSLLTIQTTLTLALLEKSLVYHIPWFVTHLSNTDYKTSKKKLWLNDLLLHVSWLLMTCAPITGLLGVGLGVAYYTSKAVRYGKFSKGFVRKKGGRGYEDPDKAKEGKGKDGEAHGVREAVMGVVDHVMHPHVPQLHLPHPYLHHHNQHEQREPETSPYGYSGYSEDILFEQPGDTVGAYQHTIQQMPPVVVQPPAPTARFDRYPYTLAGIASIWTGQKEKMKGGYDGRDVRKQNFAEDIEMADWVGRK
ncbi:hypothetical protein J4E91_000186 [Alternaria rosae]|nr:hypothetical protein J4E91_000186 [Alternaria rosae]